MIKKALTYLTILAITALPVQLISADVENVSMLMSMSQQTQMNNDCMHGQSTEQASIEKSCCNDQSHECHSCNNCPQATSAMFSPSFPVVKTALLQTQKSFSSYLFLNGVSQKNLLRPPRTLI